MKCQKGVKRYKLYLVSEVRPDLDIESIELLGDTLLVELIELIKVRFSKTENMNSYEEMKNLSQTSSMREYMRQFEIIKSRSQIEHPYLPESHYIIAFISGLRDDIKHLVISQQFRNLLDAF
jgi:glutaredoxin-related protein